MHGYLFDIKIHSSVVSMLDRRIYDSCRNSSDGLFHKHFGVCLPVCVRMTMFSGRAWLGATPIADLKQHGEHSAANPKIFRGGDIVFCIRGEHSCTDLTVHLPAPQIVVRLDLKEDQYRSCLN